MIDDIRDYLREYLDVLVSILGIYLSELVLRYLCDIKLFDTQAFLFNLFLFLVIYGLLSLFKRRIRYILDIIICLYFSIYSFAQSLHYAFFTNLFSYRKLSLASELENVMSEVYTALDIRQLMFILPLVLLIVVFILNRKKSEIIYHGKTKVIIMIMLVALGISLHIIIIQVLRMDYKVDNSWHKDYYLHEVMQNRYKYMDRFGIIEYNLKDISMTLEAPVNEISEEEKEEIRIFIEGNSQRADNAYSAIYEGENLILILCESFDESAIDEELTPTLYRLKNESYYFDNHYAPLFEVATGDSEFISETGMLPSVDNGTTSYTFNLNSYPYALANLFKEKGYNVNSYHSYMANFYNRESMHESFGFSTFYDMDKLDLERYENYKECTNWILDEELFEAVLENTDFDEPFFNFVITVSGHMPYNSERSELKEYYDIVDNNERYKDLDDESKYYLAAQISLDRGIEVLLKGLEEKGELDDTIICMFADHYPYGIRSKEARDNILGDTDTYEVYKVPMLIYGSDIEAKTFDTLTSTFDIYPTICNLFNLDDSKAYKVGSDVFSDDYRYVVFMNRSFLCEDFFYDSNNGQINDEYLDIYNKISHEINDIFVYSQKILLSDYYKE